MNISEMEPVSGGVFPVKAHPTTEAKMKDDGDGRQVRVECQTVSQSIGRGLLFVVGVVLSET